MQHINVYAWAHTVQVATSTERLVLTTLAHLLGPSGCGQVSQADVARSACITPRTAGRVMAMLATSGDIEITARSGITPTVRLSMRTPENVITPDTRSGVPPTHDRGYPRHTIRGTPETVSGVGVRGGATTVSPEYIPPYSPPTAVEDARSLAGQEGHEHRPTDHFATRRSPEPQPKIDTVGADRWFDLSKALSDRTLDRRGRFMGEGLTAAETNTVRGFIERIGIDAVERLVASMPDRVNKPTAYLAKCVDRYEADQREAKQERARVRRDGLYVAKGPLKPEDISDIDVMAALGITDEDLAS